MFPDECIPLPIYLNFYNVQFLSIAMLGNVSLLMALLQGQWASRVGDGSLAESSQ